MGPDAMILVFWMLSFKPAFSLSSFTLVKRLFCSCSLSAIRLVSAVQLLRRVYLFARLPCPSPTLGAYSNSCSLSWWCHPTHFILCCPLLLLPSIFPSIRVFSSEPVLHIRWPNYWSFSFSISPSNEYLGLISFRMDRLYFLAVQGTLKSLLQHHSSKASILQCSAFFIVQLSHPYMPTGKTIALTRQTFVGKVMSLLFNMLSRLDIAFLPRSKAAITICFDFGAPQNKVCHCFHCFPIYLSWHDGTRCHDLVFWMLSFKPTFHSPLSLSSRGSLVLLHFLP